MLKNLIIEQNCIYTEGAQILIISLLGNSWFIFESISFYRFWIIIIFHEFASKYTFLKIYYKAATC